MEVWWQYVVTAVKVIRDAFPTRYSCPLQRAHLPFTHSVHLMPSILTPPLTPFSFFTYIHSATSLPQSPFFLFIFFIYLSQPSPSVTYHFPLFLFIALTTFSSHSSLSLPHPFPFPSPPFPLPPPFLLPECNYLLRFTSPSLPLPLFPFSSSSLYPLPISTLTSLPSSPSLLPFLPSPPVLTSFSPPAMGETIRVSLPS